ncbi:hypothetical protein QJQ45_008370 [Haematococcus lacustris]|nr:hypothetical protein QJQ45_008370 [Haematococcus lacustris]
MLLFALTPGGPLEVEIAVLELYNIFNKRLPGWVDPPRRAEIQAALRKFDLSGKAALTTAILPALGFALHTSLPLTKRIPLAVLAPVLGNLAGVARMLFRL